jgi:hypothetical protein
MGPLTHPPTSAVSPPGTGDWVPTHPRSPSSRTIYLVISYLRCKKFEKNTVLQHFLTTNLAKNSRTRSSIPAGRFILRRSAESGNLLF